MRILIIEDDRNQRESLVKIIEKTYIDIKVYEAENIETAKMYLEEKKIDLFLVDINLPDGSGLELAKYIREVPEHKLTGIVFLTTQVIHIIEAFKNTHCYDFLIKPYTIDDIKRIVDVFYDECETVKKKNGYSFILSLESGVSAKIYEDDFIFAEYSHRKCTVYTSKGVMESKNIALSKILSEVKSESIIQSHKSYVVNTKYIERIERIYPKVWNIFFTVSDNVAQLSNSYKDEVFKKWEE